MEVYQLWDWDSMASNWGDHYCAGTYATRADAETEATRRNESRLASLGEHRRTETSLWKKASVLAVTVQGSA